MIQPVVGCWLNVVSTFTIGGRIRGTIPFLQRAS